MKLNLSKFQLFQRKNIHLLLITFQDHNHYCLSQYK